MQLRINAAQDHLDHGRFKQAGSTLKDIICDQEKLIADGVWNISRGNTELSVTHFMMAEVMFALSNYRLAVYHSNKSYKLCAVLFGTENSLTVRKKERMEEYKQVLINSFLESISHKTAPTA